MAFRDDVTTVDRAARSFYVDAVGTQYDSADTLHLQRGHLQLTVVCASAGADRDPPANAAENGR